MTDENEITNIVDENTNIVETNEKLETNIVEPKITKSRDEFINLDNLKIFPDEIKIF